MNPKVLKSVALCCLIVLAGCRSFNAPFGAAKTKPMFGNSAQKIDGMYSMARIAERNDQVEQAIKAHNEILGNNPQYGPSLHRLGVISSQNGDFESAMAYFEKANQAGENSAELLGDIGFALFLQGDSNGAIEKLKLANAKAPNDKRILNNLAVIMGSQKEFEESIDLFRQTGSEAESLAGLAYVQAQSGKIEEAKSNYHRALELDPQLDVAANGLVELEKLYNPKLGIEPKEEKNRTLIAQTGPKTVDSPFVDPALIAKLDSSISKKGGQANNQPTMMAPIISDTVSEEKMEKSQGNLLNNLIANTVPGETEIRNPVQPVVDLQIQSPLVNMARTQRKVLAQSTVQSNRVLLGQTTIPNRGIAPIEKPKGLVDLVAYISPPTPTQPVASDDTSIEPMIAKLTRQDLQPIGSVSRPDVNAPKKQMDSIKRLEPLAPRQESSQLEPYFELPEAIAGQWESVPVDQDKAAPEQFEVPPDTISADFIPAAIHPDNIQAEVSNAVAELDLNWQNKSLPPEIESPKKPKMKAEKKAEPATQKESWTFPKPLRSDDSNGFVPPAKLNPAPLRIPNSEPSDESNSFQGFIKSGA